MYKNIHVHKLSVLSARDESIKHLKQIFLIHVFLSKLKALNACIFSGSVLCCIFAHKMILKHKCYVIHVPTCVVVFVCVCDNMIWSCCKRYCLMGVLCLSGQRCAWKSKGLFIYLCFYFIFIFWPALLFISFLV